MYFLFGITWCSNERTLYRQALSPSVILYHVIVSKTLRQAFTTLTTSISQAAQYQPRPRFPRKCSRPVSGAAWLLRSGPMNVAGRPCCCATRLRGGDLPERRTAPARIVSGRGLVLCRRWLCVPGQDC